MLGSVRAWEWQKMQRKVLLAFFSLFIAGCAADGLAASAARNRDPQAVLGNICLWQETITPVEKITVTVPERYTIFLTGEGKLQAHFDCNSGGGAYKISEGEIFLVRCCPHT